MVENSARIRTFIVAVGNIFYHVYRIAQKNTRTDLVFDCKINDPHGKILL